MAPMIDYEMLLEAATDIAERASDIALSYFRQAILIEMKENHTPVTIADKKTEEWMRAELSLSSGRGDVRLARRPRIMSSRVPGFTPASTLR